MGQDAKANIWVGVRSSDYDVEEIKEKLPKDMFDEDGGEFFLDNEIKECVKKYGCTISMFRAFDEIEGVGIEILNHDWDYGPKKLDLAELSSKVEQAKEKLTKLFSQCNIDAEIETWLQTDYR